jgi:hypothetical protein
MMSKLEIDRSTASDLAAVRRHQIGTSSIRTTKVGDRTSHAISIDAIEKIRVLSPGTVAQTTNESGPGHPLRRRRPI